MRGEHMVRKKRIQTFPSDAADMMGKTNKYERSKAFKSQDRLTALRQKRNLTWVTGGREKLDDTSLKILETTVTGTSIFDPVLCELIYRWFCLPGGEILDPFAGGSVRGIVAGYLGYNYTGIELRPEQVAANQKQMHIVSNGHKPTWLIGDADSVDTLAPGKYDLLFSCPPYYNLEIYSDLPGELSALPTYEDFLRAYSKIIAKCVAMLKGNRFACFVVGDIRDKQGFYRNFPADTIKSFQEAGMLLYNEAILITAVGSLPLRVIRQFQAGRKLGKTHQTVLIFYRGNPKKIKELGEVECAEEPEGAST